MPLRLTPGVEFSDEDLDALAAALGPRLAAAEGSPPNVDLPPSWTKIEERQDETHTWGNGNDEYDEFAIYQGQTSTGPVELSIGRCTRQDDVKYFITHLIGPRGGKRAVTEFRATDDHESTGEMAAVIKGAGTGNQFYGPGDALPAEYGRFRVEVYRDRIGRERAYDKYVVIAHEDDVETMLNHTLIQVRTRGLE